MQKTWTLELDVSDAKRFTKAANDEDVFAVFKVTLKGITPAGHTFELANDVNMTTGIGGIANLLAGNANKSVVCEPASPPSSRGSRVMRGSGSVQAVSTRRLWGT